MAHRKESFRWQIICAAFILPHCRGESARTFRTRDSISCLHCGSLRVFKAGGTSGLSAWIQSGGTMTAFFPASDPIYRKTMKRSKFSPPNTLITITVVFARLKSRSSTRMEWNLTHQRTDMNGTAKARK